MTTLAVALLAFTLGLLVCGLVIGRDLYDKRADHERTRARLDLLSPDHYDDVPMRVHIAERHARHRRSPHSICAGVVPPGYDKASER